jgi:hypothetical protein
MEFWVVGQFETAARLQKQRGAIKEKRKCWLILIGIFLVSRKQSMRYDNGTGAGRT